MTVVSRGYMCYLQVITSHVASSSSSSSFVTTMFNDFIYHTLLPLFHVVIRLHLMLLEVHIYLSTAAILLTMRQQRIWWSHLCTTPWRSRLGHRLRLMTLMLKLFDLFILLVLTPLSCLLFTHWYDQCCAFIPTMQTSITL